MLVKVGDRVSIDSFKVGQPRRTGTVQNVAEGISGIRYLVRWDDGHESFFSPSGGNLIVEQGRARKRNNAKTPARKTASTAGKAPTAKARKTQKGKR